MHKLIQITRAVLLPDVIAKEGKRENKLLLKLGLEGESCGAEYAKLIYFLCVGISIP